jgi:hypothetical protein
VVGLDGVEPSTSRLSGVRSNRTELQAPIEPLIIFQHYKEHELDLSKLNSDTKSCYAVFYLSKRYSILRKEVIQPLVPQRLPCYDFTPIISHTLGACFLYRLAQQLLVQPTLMV